MDISLIVRILPALLVAVGVAWLAVRHTGVRLSAIVDATLEVAIVGVVAARLVWVAIDGLEAALRAPTTVFLVRSGVETWAGVAVAVAWGLWRWGPDRLAWARIAAPAAGLAGVAAWQAACEAENACAGIPAEWGVALPGYLSPVVPTGYIEAAIVAVLAVVAFRYRHRLEIAVGAVAVYALVRGGLGFLRSPLVALPTRDQVLSLAAALAFAAFAIAFAGRSGRRGRADARPLGSQDGGADQPRPS
jgi:prolipoprotein diacylglyceryltransferase